MARPSTQAAPLSAEEETSTSKQAARPKLGTDGIAAAILATEHFALDAGGKLYAYRNGVYLPRGTRHLEACVKRVLNQQEREAEWSNYRVGEVRGYIEADAPELWPRPPLSALNLANGLLDLESLRLRPHDPAFLSPVQLPVEYDPGADCPRWDNFLAQILPDDCRSFPYELAGWLMLPNRNIQRCALLLGEGRNGKSTLLAAIVAFLGKQNCAGLSLQRIERDRFATSRLIGKLANVCADLPSSHLETTSLFKAITGDDPVITAEYKHLDSFDFECFARLVFSANQHPRGADNSEAFFSRWLVVPFERTFTGRAAIPRETLDPLLQQPSELSGVLNRALDCLPRVQLATTLTEAPSMLAAQAEFRRTTDPLAVWLDAQTLAGPEAFSAKHALLDAYNETARQANRPTMNNTNFGLAIRRLRPDLMDGQRTLDGEVKHVYLGIGLRAAKNGATQSAGVGDTPGPRQPSRVYAK